MSNLRSNREEMIDQILGTLDTWEPQDVLEFAKELWGCEMDGLGDDHVNLIWNQNCNPEG